MKTGAHSAKLKASITGDTPSPSMSSACGICHLLEQVRKSNIGGSIEKRLGGPLTIFTVMQAKKGTFKSRKPIAG